MLVAFDRQRPQNLVPVHHDNAASRDWIILLEANTIVPGEGARLRVARTTQERKIVRRFRFPRFRFFLAIEGYDSRIHVVFFCPQLYKYDHDGELIPMRGEEIGQYVAQALDHKATVRCPWYHPMEALPEKPLIAGLLLSEFDSLVIETPSPSILPSALERLVDDRAGDISSSRQG
jgi:hypothetical protein